jgi:hypothetical protein
VKIDLINKTSEGFKVDFPHSVDLHSAEVAPEKDYSTIGRAAGEGLLDHRPGPHEGVHVHGQTPRRFAAGAGAPTEPEPFRPVLRGMLLTGGERLFLRHAVAGGGGEGDVSDQAPWWPPTKISGRYLSPYLFGEAQADSRAAPTESPQ